MLSLVAICGSISCVDLQAADEDVSHSLEFYTLAWTGSIDGLKYQASSTGEVYTIQANTRYLNGPYRYMGTPRLTFFTEQNQPDGSTMRVPEAYVDIPQTVDKAILLIYPDERTRYRIIAISINGKNFAAGSYRFINLTQRDVAIKLGDVREVVKAGSHEVVLPAFGDRQRFSTQIAAPSKASGWELIFSAEWTHDRRKRVLVIFYEDANGDVHLKVQPI